jgi:hypothetical protein
MFEPCPCPRAGLMANLAGPAPALIEGIVLLPSPLSLRIRSWLAAFYPEQHLSAREFSRIAS